MAGGSSPAQELSMLWKKQIEKPKLEQVGKKFKETEESSPSRICGNFILLTEHPTRQDKLIYFYFGRRLLSIQWGKGQL